MADAALFIGWGYPRQGREAQAVELFGEAMGFYARLQEEGRIEGVEPVFLEPHGGDLGGFILIRGDADELAALRVSDEFAELSVRSQILLEGFGVVGADLGARLERLMGYYTEQVAAIA